MTTATGDFAINYAVLGDADPYTNANFTLFDTGFNFKILSGVLRPSNGGSGQFGARRWYYNGTMTASATVRSKFEVGNAASGDELIAWCIKTDGTGYALRANQTAVSINTVTGAAGSPSFAGLVSATAAGNASGDIFELEVVPDFPIGGTNTLNGYRTPQATGIRALIVGLTTTDTTYTGVRPSPGFDAENASASTIISWAGDGITITSGMPRNLLLLGVG